MRRIPSDSTRILRITNNTIPAIRIDPTSATIMKDVWTPDGSGDHIIGLNNFRLVYSW